MLTMFPLQPILSSKMHGQQHSQQRTCMINSRSVNTRALLQYVANDSNHTAAAIRVCVQGVACVS